MIILHGQIMTPKQIAKILKHLNAAREAMDAAITATPTSKTRDEMSDIDIALASLCHYFKGGA